MAKERAGAANVVAQEQERVQVEHRGDRLTVPLKGFPPGFVLRPGSRVILVDEPSGPVARPLVRALRQRLRRADVERRGPLDVQGRRVELQPGTVLDEIGPPGETRAEDDYEVWVVEGADPAAQVIAARRHR